MDLFMKATATVLVALLLYLTLSSGRKEFAVLLTFAVVCIIGWLAIEFITPIISFIQELSAIGKLNTDLLDILLKAVGIGLISEFTCLICSDAGNATLGKALQILASLIILWLSIPLFKSLIEMLKEIMVAI